VDEVLRPGPSEIVWTGMSLLLLVGVLALIVWLLLRARRR
jgi:hypothetical protein